MLWLHLGGFENQNKFHWNFYPPWASQLLYTCGPWQSCLQENVVHQGLSRLSILRSVICNMYLLRHHMLAFRGTFLPKGAKFSTNFDFTFRPDLKHFWKLQESLVWLVRDTPIILVFTNLHKLCRYWKWPPLLISLFLISIKIDYFSGESKQLADPDVLKRLTSSVRFVFFSHHWSPLLLGILGHQLVSQLYYILTSSWKPCTALLFSFFDENALQLCPGRGSGGSDPHALRACCAAAWHRQVNKQTINKTSGNFSLNDWLASVLGLSQLVSFRSLVAACSQGDIGRVRRLLDEVAKVFSDWDALLQLLADHLFCSTCKQL